MIVITCDQRTPEWFAARLGRVTGSKAKAIYVQPNRDGSEKAERRDYRMQLCLERLTGRIEEPSFVNDDMKRGIELEPAALAAYEALTGQVVTRVGFLQHETIMAGCSPDGLVGSAGVLELKAPRPANHFAYLEAKTLPAEHKAQCVHACWITGAKWVDLLSYCPAMPPKLQTFLVRYERDEKEMAAHALVVSQFLREVDATVSRIQALQGVA